MVDPRFPRGRRQPLGGRGSNLLFEIKEILAKGGASLAPPRSANELLLVNLLPTAYVVREEVIFFSLFVCSHPGGGVPTQVWMGGGGVPTLNSGWGEGGVPTLRSGWGGVPTLRSGWGGEGGTYSQVWMGGEGGTYSQVWMGGRGGYLLSGLDRGRGVPTLRSGTGGGSGGEGGYLLSGLDCGGEGGYLGRYPPFPPTRNSITWTGLCRGRYASCVLAQEDFLVDIYFKLSVLCLCNTLFCCVTLVKHDS